MRNDRRYDLFRSFAEKPAPCVQLNGRVWAFHIFWHQLRSKAPDRLILISPNKKRGHSRSHKQGKVTASGLLIWVVLESRPKCRWVSNWQRSPAENSVRLRKDFAYLFRWYFTCLNLLSPDQRLNVLSFLVSRTRGYINFDYEEHKGKNQKCNAQHKQESYRLRYFKPIQSLNKHTEDDNANKQPTANRHANWKVTEPTPPG